MNCHYCVFYCESPTRIGEDRFCNHIQKMVRGENPICEDGFEAYHIFWCKRTSQQIDLIVCPARQERGMEECKKCQQKNIILEIRKLMGRKNGGEKKLIKKKTNYEQEQENLENTRETAVTEEKTIVTSMQRKKIILHKKKEEQAEPEVSKTKIVLHKRVKEPEEIEPAKKTLIRKK